MAGAPRASRRRSWSRRTARRSSPGSPARSCSCVARPTTGAPTSPPRPDSPSRRRQARRTDMAVEGTTHQDARVDSTRALALYRTMRLIRRFEETVQTLFLRGEVHGTTHLYIGQEAVATGVGDVLGPDDRVAATYRGHGHALSIGVEPSALLDEMLGRKTGVCGGRAGSMNVVDLEHRLIGSFGIIGGSMAAATGASLSLRRTGGVAVAYFGDGSTNHGYFHECLNFAAVQKLPVVYVCENNLYGEFTPWEDVTAGQIIDRPRALGIDARQGGGMAVPAVPRAPPAAGPRG